MRLLRRWIQLSGADKRLVWEAFLYFGFVKVCLVVFPFGVFLKIYSKYLNWIRSESSYLDIPRNEMIPKLAWVIQTGAFHLPGENNCLTQVLTGNLLFRAHGIVGECHIGGKKAGSSEFSAHAWLVVNQETVLGRIEELSQYRDCFILEC